MDAGSNGIFMDLGLILLLVLINAFFAASEMAMVSVNRNKIGYLADEGNSKAKLLLKLLKEPSRFLATIQVGITFAGFLASASAAVSISEVLANVMERSGIAFLAANGERIALVVVTILLSFVTLVLGELLPKRLALVKSEGIALFAVKPIQLLSKFMKPFVFILTGTTNFLARLLGSTSENAEEKVTEEEIKMMIHVGEEHGVLNPTETEMMDGIFRFDNTLAREVMTPRTDIFAMDIDTPIKEIIQRMKGGSFSRVPIYEGDLDHIKGILYLKDLFYRLDEHNGEGLSIHDVLRPAYFVLETKNIDILFRQLQYKKQHMAILINEYGSVSGLLTIEDLLEEIVGDIYDEHDEATRSIEKIDQHTFMVHGMVPIHDINHELDLELSNKFFNTIGGFVLNLIGDIPAKDEHPTVQFEDVSFTVEGVKGRRLERIKINKEK